MTPKEIIDKFGEEAYCRNVNYRDNTKVSDKIKLKHVKWKSCIALTVLFDKPKFYMVDGDEAVRDGVRIVVD